MDSDATTYYKNYVIETSYVTNKYKYQILILFWLLFKKARLKAMWRKAVGLQGQQYEHKQ